jgi:hypothetical protein
VSSGGVISQWPDRRWEMKGSTHWVSVMLMAELRSA